MNPIRIQLPANTGSLLIIFAGIFSVPIAGFVVGREWHNSE